MSGYVKKLLHTPLKRKWARGKKTAQEAFENLCTKLEEDCENGVYSLSDLHLMTLALGAGSKLKNFAGGGRSFRTFNDKSWICKFRCSLAENLMTFFCK